MKKLLVLSAILVRLLIAIPLAYANIPSAYLACEGAELGDRCSMPGPQYGTCTRDTLCTDPSETMINECILCVDDCWNLEEGKACTRRFTGTSGVCQLQDLCTDKVETSFQECNRCVDALQDQMDISSKEESCAQFDFQSSILVCFILGLFIRKFLRRIKI